MKSLSVYCGMYSNTRDSHLMGCPNYANCNLTPVGNEYLFKLTGDWESTIVAKP
jgi:hypothetical protein